MNFICHRKHIIPFWAATEPANRLQAIQLYPVYGTCPVWNYFSFDRTLHYPRKAWSVQKWNTRTKPFASTTRGNKVARAMENDLVYVRPSTSSLWWSPPPARARFHDALKLNRKSFCTQKKNKFTAPSCSSGLSIMKRRRLGKCNRGEGRGCECDKLHRPVRWHSWTARHPAGHQ